MPGDDENERAMAEAERNMTPAQRELEARINRALTSKVSGHRRAITWLEQIEALKPGDACEFQYPARAGWLPAIVVRNGGSGYWTLKRTTADEDGELNEIVNGIYIEGVRLPGQTEAWPR